MYEVSQMMFPLDELDENFLSTYCTKQLSVANRVFHINLRIYIKNHITRQCHGIRSFYEEVIRCKGEGDFVATFEVNNTPIYRF